MSKRWFYSVVEEGIQNPDYAGYRGGRIEVYDSTADTGYAVYEARFLMPEEMIEGFRDLFDMKEYDLPIHIMMDGYTYGGMK